MWNVSLGEMQSVSEVEKCSHLPFEMGRHRWISHRLQPSESDIQGT